MTPVVTTRRLRGLHLAGYDKGRGILTQALWFAVMNTVFMAWFTPAGSGPPLLRAFGAAIGEGVLIRHRVRVLWPWKLTVGDHTWIGEGAWILNLEPVTLGAHVCVSQEAMLCTGSHDHRAADLRSATRRSRGDGAWVAARAMVLRGVNVGRGRRRRRRARSPTAMCRRGPCTPPGVPYEDHPCRDPGQR